MVRLEKTKDEEKRKQEDQNNTGKKLKHCGGGIVGEDRRRPGRMFPRRDVCGVK
jgi:hypothetical protein